MEKSTVLPAQPLSCPHPPPGQGRLEGEAYLDSGQMHNLRSQKPGEAPAPPIQHTSPSQAGCRDPFTMFL
jgi:hypothetical protein